MPYKLLLADDSVTIQRVIELTFADEDVQVIAVGDGRQAIEKIQAERPDIVLADVGMPERDGYEVAAFVKQSQDFRHIPVLLLTGAFEPIDETRARTAGCDGVLVKPFEPQMVISRVKDLLAGRRPAELWTAGPAAHTPLRQPAAPAAGDFDLQSAPAPEAPSGSLEDYFDRLDAAFANLEGARPADGAEPVVGERPTAPPPSAPPHARSPGVQPAPERRPDDLAGWDPDLTGDPARPAPVPSLAIAAQVAAPSAPVAAQLSRPTAQAQAEVSGTVPEGPIPPLADAFAALLAAEQGQPFIAAAHPGSTISNDTIEDIVRRVVDRMTDQAVRKTVIDVAERLVREEIERIKSQV